VCEARACEGAPYDGAEVVEQGCEETPVAPSSCRTSGPPPLCLRPLRRRAGCGRSSVNASWNVGAARWGRVGRAASIGSPVSSSDAVGADVDTLTARPASSASFALELLEDRQVLLALKVLVAVSAGWDT